MKTESEDLYGALWQIGSEEDDEPIHRETLDRLAELRIVEIHGGKAALTESGWRLYTAMESGEAEPEFSDNPF
jgi:hypothetical protein